jgi:hypothetical protein
VPIEYREASRSKKNKKSEGGGRPGISVFPIKNSDLHKCPSRAAHRVVTSSRSSQRTASPSRSTTVIVENKAPGRFLDENGMLSRREAGPDSWADAPDSCCPRRETGKSRRRDHVRRRVSPSDSSSKKRRQASSRRCASIDRGVDPFLSIDSDQFGPRAASEIRNVRASDGPKYG